MRIKRFFKKIGSFFKRNAYYVILFLCISGIATMITLAAVNSNNNSNNNIIDNNNNDDNNNNNNNNNNDDDDDDDDVNTTPILFVLPVSVYEEGMLFSGNEPFFSVTLKDFRTHKGMDFVTTASANVVACYDGIVQSVYKNAREGNVVVIKHNDELFTIYKSLSDDVTVEENYNVKKGDIIGYTSDSMGDERKEGPHLHLEVKYQGKLINPTEFLDIGDK